MGINPELLRLNREPNFNEVYELFRSMLAHNCPDLGLLKKLYGSEKSGIIFDNIREYFIEDNSPVMIPRVHNLEAPFEIYNARRDVEKNKCYQRIQSAILKNDLPSESDLSVFYGKYSPNILKIIETYKELNLKRKCELNAATHLSRVGAVVFQLKMNDDRNHKYSAIAMMHDSVEDLLDYSKFSRDGKIHLDYYNAFLDEYVPFELQDSVKTLTNHYNFLINFIKEKLNEEDKSISLKNILQLIDNLQRAKLEGLNDFLEKMFNLLINTELEGDLLDSAKWACYESLYLNGIAEASIEKDDYRIFEIKGVDLSDNAHGKGALSVDAKIRNIKKNMLWGIIGYRMHSSWKPLNDKIEEIMEDSLQSAEFLILSDLLQLQSSQDFVMSALYKIKKLEPVFYTN